VAKILQIQLMSKFLRKYFQSNIIIQIDLNIIFLNPTLQNEEDKNLSFYHF
jgi:hypothetical protein